MAHDNRGFPIACSSCKYFDTRDVVDTTGLCRINPPVYGEDPEVYATGHWPRVWPEDWCGKWEAK